MHAHAKNCFENVASFYLKAHLIMSNVCILETNDLCIYKSNEGMYFFEQLEFKKLFHFIQNKDAV